MVLNLISRAFVVGSVSLLAFGSALNAAARLSLDQTAFTLSVAQGSNGPTQTVNAQNIGTGSLKLTVSSSVPWLVPTLGSAQQCGITGQCTMVQIAVQSSSLANGMYTGTVTITDPNAVDAPQFVTVTLNVGGTVPNSLEFYLAPGSSTSTTFTTGSTINSSVNNAPWLSIAVNGSGSFSFNVPYVVTATASSGMTPMDYNGTLTISGSKFAPDNKQIPLLLHVTTSPILQAAPASLNIKIAQGANKQTSTNGSLPYISTANLGQGTLTISSVSATTSSGSWLSTSSVSGFPSLVAVTADPTGLSPGVYQGTVTIASNAANSSVAVPVQLTVESQGAPVAFPGGVVNNGTFVGNQPLALGDITAVFGDQFTYGDPASASSLPLGTTLGNTQVMVNGTAAPVYYVSPGQINFQIPFEASTGDGTIQVVRNGTAGNTISVNIANAAPSFLLLNGGPYVIMTTPQGALTGIAGAPVHANDVVVIYTIGLGPTSPAVPSGTASPNPPAVVGQTQVCFGEHAAVTKPPVCQAAQFSGLTPGFVGLYQINVAIPSGLPTGNVPIYYTVAGQASDQETIAVQ
ncbi:MAG TPA: hypothetical protein VKG79_13125 [Bryobacteraceae bacterium]|nr:hypothetical protein [Bryobacteraceae bacterium]